jgi:hypothetical protein
MNQGFSKSSNSGKLQDFISMLYAAESGSTPFAIINCLHLGVSQNEEAKKEASGQHLILGFSLVPPVNAD